MPLKVGRAQFRFSVGPWNLHPGADPFGPPVREEFSWAQKMEIFKEIGFDAIQFHDDDVCAADLNERETSAATREMKKQLKDLGFVAEFVAPRLWEHPNTIDGGWTNNDPKMRAYALNRSKRTIDIALELGTKKIVLWPAREGTYIREAKDPFESYKRYFDYLNALLEYDKSIQILGEMKPNEPTDAAYLPTPGHFLAVGAQSVDPKRVGVLIESAHSMLLGIDPSEDMALCLALGKLWGVHLNDQDGLKYDQDKSFGSVNIRRAFNQVWVLVRGGFGAKGEYVGLDVKAMRTQRQDESMAHLKNSLETFKDLCEVVEKVDADQVEGFRRDRDYEALDQYILGLLLGKKR
jgi:xylose isomerase